MSLKLPCTLGGRYQCDERIGSGGMGEVYRARHLGLDRDVAVKVLSVVGLEKNQEERIKERFKREAVALSKLRHPNTVQVVDFGWTDDKRPYIVTELLTGRTLDHLLRDETRLSAGRAIHILSQVCMSLAEAHQHGIVHRDLKPSNVFLVEIIGQKDFVKVIDFGVARVAVTDDINRARPLTVEGTTLGTPDYMAPEQARAQTPTAATDVYALGCILYELLAGEPPYIGDTALQVMVKHITHPVPQILAVRPDLGPGLADAVARAMSKDPAQRPQDAGGFLEVLRKIPRSEATVSLPDLPRSATPPASSPDSAPLVASPASDTEVDFIPPATPEILAAARPVAPPDPRVVSPAVAVAITPPVAPAVQASPASIVPVTGRRRAPNLVPEPVIELEEVRSRAEARTAIIENIDDLLMEMRQPRDAAPPKRSRAPLWITLALFVAGVVGLTVWHFAS